MADSNTEAMSYPKGDHVSKHFSKGDPNSSNVSSMEGPRRSRNDSHKRGSPRGRGGGGRGDGRGGRGRGGRGGRDEGNRRKERGRAEWSRDKTDKRKRNADEQESKRRKFEETGVESLVGVKYSAEEIAAESRQPKRKVAVLIGYAGTGYKGMQLNDKEKTIEGDLFNAFVKAGAISKANADDPKKSSLVRCARTDKGVHAAGNVISLKLIIEDPDIVQKMNDNLPPQIRVWGYERTNGSFSCYQSCDSRWYEYLIPTYSFLPPSPQSFLGKALVVSAEREGVAESYRSRQEEVSSFWELTEKEYIEPILAQMDPELAKAVMEAIHSPVDDSERSKLRKEPKKMESEGSEVVTNETAVASHAAASDGATTNVADYIEPTLITADDTASGTNPLTSLAASDLQGARAKRELTPLEAAVAEVKAAYIRAKKAYRIAPVRRQRVQDALNQYLGTQNYHNYTIQKSFKDPSAKRVIKSFNVGTDPIIINDTEWLSLKVHGQSFMMHQIRKMVAMAALVVRCGTDLSRIKDSYGPENISIPKAPSLGLLLERPVFDSYNERALRELEKEKIDFTKFETQMEEFKQREIYNRIFEVENHENQFHVFFHHIDQYKTDYFLWVTAEGLAATRQAKNAAMEPDSEDEGPQGNEEG